MSEGTAASALKALQEEFSLFDDVEDKYAHIIDMGKNIAPLDDAEKVDSNKVRGCVSSVWVIFRTSENGALHFYADSDAFIVKGLLAVLLRIYSGKTPEDILSVSVSDIAEALELTEHLSRSRNNGFIAVGERITAAAASSLCN